MEKDVLKLIRSHCLCGLSIVGSCGGLDDFNLYNAIYMLTRNWWRERWSAIRSSGAAARALVGTLSSFLAGSAARRRILIASKSRFRIGISVLAGMNPT